jgi:hypothetical protein
MWLKRNAIHSVIVQFITIHPAMISVCQLVILRGAATSRNEVSAASNDLCVYFGLRTPLPPRSFGIMGLGNNSRQVFGFKGLAGKVFINHRFSSRAGTENGLGQLRAASQADELSSALPQSSFKYCA